MNMKKHNGKIYGAALSKNEEKALKLEITRQLLEYDAKHGDNIDAVVLYTLHKDFGFGPRRLRQFYESVKQNYTELVKHYEMPDDYPFICKTKLKDIGVDIEAWNKEFMSTI